MIGSKHMLNLKYPQQSYLSGNLVLMIIQVIDSHV